MNVFGYRSLHLSPQVKNEREKYIQHGSDHEDPKEGPDNIGYGVIMCLASIKGVVYLGE